MAIQHDSAMAQMAKGFLSLPLMRQLALWFGVTASIAIAVYAAQWSVAPHYLPLYTALEPKEIGQVTEALDQAAVHYQFHPGSGGILVPAEKVHEVRMRLSALGLPKSGPVGFEIMDENQGFMGSHFAEFIRYRRALEGELSRTLSNLSFVRSARVHLGLAKESSFIKKQVVSGASVVLDIAGRKTPDDTQIMGIVHLVASSVPGLSKEAVSVVDQHGTLLSAKVQETLGGGVDVFRYTQQIEQAYTKRIQAVLAPMVGADGVHAEVTADLDFSAVDELHERFDPQNVVVRSENVLTERKGKKGEAGIPGALSNQPFFLRNQVAQGTADMPHTNHVRDQSTRNFEVDKSVKHVKHPAGRLLRLSVAVVVDDKNLSLSDAQLAKIEAVVKHAIGYQAARGDTVHVTHAAFTEKLQQENFSAMPFYEHPSMMVLLKIVVVGLLGLSAIFMIFKPLFIRLMQLSKQEEALPRATPEAVDPSLKNQAMLRAARPQDVARIMQKEHPQIQAMILSYLTPEQSAAVMHGMPEDVRVDLMVRLATLSSITPEALNALDNMLQQQLSGHGDALQ